MFKFEGMKWLFPLFSFLLSCSSLTAQYHPERVNKKAAALYEKAIARAQEDDFAEGIRLLRNALRIDPGFEDGCLSIAGMYGELKHYDSAIYFYEMGRAIDSNYFKDYNLPYSINLAGKGYFDKAIAAIESFLSIPNLNEKSRKAAEYRKSSYRFAADYAQQKKLVRYHFEPKNMGEAINSRFSEYFPSLTLDAGEFIFTRRVNNFNEDFYGSHRMPDGSWEPAQGLSGDINTNHNEGAQNISQDGEWLIFTACNLPEGMGSCDLYISFNTPEGWSAPENLGPVINTEDWESSPSLSPDKRDLYFASRRPDGYGGSDLYVSHLQANGQFGPPENLGPAINTPGDESCPFIHADNQTLYFTSNGHIGYGGDDLFLIKKGPKGLWSKPVNLGFPINTIENEGSMVVAADGKTAYYASDRNDGYGGLDLYSFELRDDVRPARTLWVRGKVFDRKTGKGLPSAVELTDLNTREVLSRLQTDETGNYLITLPTGKDYAFTVNRRGYLFFSEHFSLSGKPADSIYAMDIGLQPIEVNAGMVLKNIFFESNRYELQEASFTELDKVVQLLKENPTVSIEISGHTDNTGSAEENLKLSNNRAQAVVDYLTRQQIPVQRLLSKGYGAAQPIDSNETPEGRARNRRTELKIIRR